MRVACLHQYHDILAGTSLESACEECYEDYEESLLLAEELTELTGVLTAPGLLARASYTRPQVGLELP